MMNEENQQTSMTLNDVGAFETDAKLSSKAQKLEMPRIDTFGFAEEDEEGTGKKILPGNTVAGYVVNPREAIPSKGEFARDAILEGENAEKTYTDRLVLQSKKGVTFGVWHTRTLLNQAVSMIEGDYVEIKYLGKADKPFSKGQALPHLIEVKITDSEGRKVDVAARRKAGFATGMFPDLKG